MAATEFIAAIELASSKVVGMAGRKNSDGSMQVLAYAKEDSFSFIRKGVIYNLDKTTQSLTSIINKLEKDLKNPIAKVYVAVGGQSLRTVRNVVARDLKQETIISQELVDSICDENLAIPLVDMDILEVAPQEYKIDNLLQADPVGVAGAHIEGRFLNIVARAAIRKNMERCFEQAKIEIAEIFVAPLVTANAVLSESERRSGCALVDFGADTTTISIYKNNILRFLAVLPLGGNSITRDIVSMQLEEEDAEQLKVKYGNAMYEEAEEETGAAMVQLEEGGRSIELRALNNIVEARAEEIIANTWNQIQQSGYDDKLLSGIIITGGGANLKSLEGILRKRSKMEKIRTARNIRNAVHGNSEWIKKDGSQNTLLGLLFEGKENCSLTESIPYVQSQPAVNTISNNLFDEDETLKEQEAAAREAKKKREEEEKRRKEEEKRARDKERIKIKKKEGPSWFEKTFNKITDEIFSDEDMK